jgi:hypothetical protein
VTRPLRRNLVSLVVVVGVLRRLMLPRRTGPALGREPSTAPRVSIAALDRWEVEENRGANAHASVNPMGMRQQTPKRSRVGYHHFFAAALCEGWWCRRPRDGRE